MQTNKILPAITALSKRIGEDPKVDVPASLRALVAWFESQGINEAQAGTACCTLAGILCGLRASNAADLMVGATILSRIILAAANLTMETKP